MSRVKEPLLEATQSFHSGLTHSELQPEKQCVMEQDCTHAHVQSSSWWLSQPCRALVPEQQYLGPCPRSSQTPDLSSLPTYNMAGKGQLPFPDPSPCICGNSRRFFHTLQKWPPLLSLQDLLFQTIVPRPPK